MAKLVGCILLVTCGNLYGQVGLQIHNYAQVSPDILMQAKDETTAIFRRIGVEIVWSECAVNLEGEVACASVPADVVSVPLHFKVRILRQTLYPKENWKMGVALREAALANVFYDRVADFVVRFLSNVGKESMM